MTLERRDTKEKSLCNWPTWRIFRMQGKDEEPNRAQHFLLFEKTGMSKGRPRHVEFTRYNTKEERNKQKNYTEKNSTELQRIPKKSKRLSPSTHTRLTEIML